ncbi:MAG: hypothetical protein K2N31_02115 [Treponemataceae bacterium]|nr:hypothetical protein [Treponemataceae bacterium]
MMKVATAIMTMVLLLFVACDANESEPIEYTYSTSYTLYDMVKYETDRDKIGSILSSYYRSNGNWDYGSGVYLMVYNGKSGSGMDAPAIEAIEKYPCVAIATGVSKNEHRTDYKMYVYVKVNKSTGSPSYIRYSFSKREL